MSGVNHMGKYRKFGMALMLITLIGVVFNIFSEYNKQPLTLILLLSLIVAMIINGYFRTIKFENQPKYTFISLLYQ